MQCDKRQKKRLVKTQTERFLEILHEDNQNENAAVVNVDDLNNAQDIYEKSPPVPLNEKASEIATNSSYNTTVTSKLGQWQLTSRTSNKHMKELLLILRDAGLDVPISATSLLKKIESKPNIIKIEPGEYVHFGIKTNLQKAEHIIRHHDEIIFDVNIDGIPLFKSSNRQLWPILLRVVNIPQIDVFPVGIYSGKHKPNNVLEYLKKFVDEFSDLKENKLVLGEKEIAFKIRAVICDAPAKAFVCGIPHHSSLHGCSKCTQLCTKKNNFLVYSNSAAELITDHDFRIRKFQNHHHHNFLNNLTPFEKINLKMISQVPLDPMHLIDLGVTRKMLTRLFKNKIRDKISHISHEY